MGVGEEAIDIRAEPAAIFELIHDYDRHLLWDPFLKEARLLGGVTRAAKGVSTLCVARNRLAGLAMETVYVSFDPPRVAAVKMTRGPVFLESFAASLRQEPVAPGLTRVVYRYHFQARPRWLRLLVDPVLKSVFSRETRRRLEALRRFMEAGPKPGQASKDEILRERT